MRWAVLSRSESQVDGTSRVGDGGVGSIGGGPVGGVGRGDGGEEGGVGGVRSIRAGGVGELVERRPTGTGNTTAAGGTCGARGGGGVGMKLVAMPWH
eukprot:3315988-Pleurochrysis_carterae.AAC.1